MKITKIYSSTQRRCHRHQDILIYNYSFFRVTLIIC